MDDLQFRRSILADPHASDAELAQEQLADPVKRQFTKDVQAFDKKIANALAVDVPEDLSQKILFKQTMLAHQQQQKKSRIQLAVAASVAFAIGLSVNFMSSSPAYSTVGDYALAHVRHEIDSFTNDMPARVSLASVNDKMASYQAQFTEQLGELISANYCHFGNIKSLHLVYKGQTAPVTVFVIPKDSGFKLLDQFNDNQFHGVAEQFKQAEVIVVGSKQEPLKQWQKNIETNISWSI